MVRMRRPRVGGTKASSPRLTILLRAPRSPVLPPSHQHVRVMMVTVSLFRKNALPLVRRGYEPKSRVVASTTRTCHLDGYPQMRVGSSPFASRRPCCRVLPAPSTRTKKLDAPDRTNSTVSGTCVVGCATGPELRQFLKRLRVSARTTALLFWVGTFLACLVTRCLTSTNPAPIGVSKDGDIPDGTSCRVA